MPEQFKIIQCLMFGAQHLLEVRTIETFNVKFLIMTKLYRQTVIT